VSHARAQIRQQVATLLTAAVGSRVYINPHEDIAADQMPAYVITTPDETIENLMNRRERTLTVQVECIGIGIDEADDITVNVENALDDSSLGNLVTDWALSSTLFTFTRDQAKQIASAKLTFSCKYMTSMTDPTVIV
jgi:hypothetical protein